MFKDRSIFFIEKKSVFLINFLLIILVILSFIYDISLQYFFYFNVVITFFLAYFFFKHSKKLAKMLIVTNMFIFFYFLYPKVSVFFSEIFGAESYIFIIFYNILIAYLFLLFSGQKEGFRGNLKKINFLIVGIVILIGLSFGLFFTLIKEPIPTIFTTFGEDNNFEILRFLLFSSFLVAFSEQMIFSGFLFNVYQNLNSKHDAFYQVAIIFVMFHLLRFEILVKHYYANFSNMYIFYIGAYYLLLFAFMLTALYLYSFKTEKYEGNFIYPVILHFMADFGLFVFYYFKI